MGRRATYLVTFILFIVILLVGCNRNQVATATPQPTAAVSLVTPTVTAVLPTATSMPVPSRTPNAPSRTPAPTRTLTPTRTPTPRFSPTPTVSATPPPAPSPTQRPGPTAAPLATCPPQINGPLLTETGSPHILWVGPHTAWNETPIHPNDQVAIAFAQPMDHASTEAAFSIGRLAHNEWPIFGDFSWCDNTLVYQPRGYEFSPYSIYYVNLEPGATTANGQPILDERFHFEFYTTGIELVHFGFGPAVQTLASSGPRLLSFRHSHLAPTQLKATLYQLNLPQFLEIYNQFITNRFPTPRAYPTVGLVPFEQWQVDMPSAENPYTIQGLALPQDAPPGWYLVELAADADKDQLLVVLSDSALMVTELREETAVWVTGHDGLPRSGVQVQFHSADGLPIASGLTDDNGLFQIAAAAPAFVTASLENDIAITFQDQRWRTGYYSGRVICDYDWPPRPQHSVYFYTDSPVYHAGETVSFRAVILEDEDGVLSPLPVDTPVTLQIMNLVDAVVARTDETSSVNSQFQIPSTARGSQQTVTLSVNGQQYSHPLEIVSPATTPGPNDPQVHFTITTQPYGSNQPLTITVEVRDPAGQSLPNVPVGLTMFERYSWGWDTAYNSLEGGETVADGRYITTTMRPFPDSFMPGPWAIRIDTIGKQFWQIIPPPPAPVTPAATIQLDTNGKVKLPGQPFTVQGRFLNTAGEPMAGRTLAVEVYGGTHYNPVASVLEQATSVTTDGEGRFTQSFTLERNDDFVIVAKGQDDQGREIVASAGIYILGLGDNDHSRNLNVVPERDSYTPGETATIYIESNFGGPALLSVEGGTLRRAMTVTLTAPFTALSLPILPDDVPNISISLQAWHPLDSNLEPAIYLDRTDADVVVHPPLLNVAITPPQIPLAAGQQGQFTLQVTDAQGRPVSATTSLSLVSEIAYTYGTPLESIATLYVPREHPWRNYDNLTPLRKWEIYPLNTGCGGGDDDSQGIVWPSLPFPTPAVWQPTITTDANGRATVTLTMPDTPGDWRLTVKAVAAGVQVGETSLVVPIE